MSVSERVASTVPPEASISDRSLRATSSDTSVCPLRNNGRIDGDRDAPQVEREQREPPAPCEATVTRTIAPVRTMTPGDGFVASTVSLGCSDGSASIA